MRAVVLRAPGPPGELRIEEVPEPVAGPGEVVVDVEVASITFVETQIRAGRPPHPSMSPALPAVPGNGVGGRVQDVGEGVDPALLGLAVVTTTGGTGGYAERVAVPADRVVPVPAGLDVRSATALLADGRTAIALARAARIARGETVLVEAAAGGVGSLLVQLARNAGAHVVATAGGERKLGVARALGAATVLDHARPGWADALASVDVAFDGVGGDVGRAAFEHVRRGGRFLPFGMASGGPTAMGDGEAAGRGVDVVRTAPLTPADMRERTEAALRLAAAGRLRPIVGQTFALERAADAHAAIEARATVGKTLLVVGGQEGAARLREAA